MSRMSAFPVFVIRSPALVRMADMCLRPLERNFAFDPRWWDFDDVRLWSGVAVGVWHHQPFLFGRGALRLHTRHYTAHRTVVKFFVLLSTFFLAYRKFPSALSRFECYHPVIILAAAASPSQKTAHKFPPALAGKCFNR